EVGRVGRVGGDVAGRPAAEQAVLVGLATARARVVGSPVDRRRYLERASDPRARGRAELDDLVVVPTRLQVGRVEERRVDAAIRSHGRGGHERLVQITGDDLRRGPRLAAVVGDRAVDPRAEGLALLAEFEVAVRHDRVAGAPRRHILLVEQVADAGLV